MGRRFAVLVPTRMSALAALFAALSVFAACSTGLSATADSVSQIQAAMRAQEAFETISFRCSTTFRQNIGGKWTERYTEKGEYDLSGNRYRCRSEIFGDGNKRLFSKVIGDYGTAVACYYPERKLAIIRQSGSVPLQKNAILPIMGTSIDGHRLAEFDLEDTPATFDRALQLAGGSNSRKLYFSGYEGGLVVLCATGRFRFRDSVVAKAWLDPSHNWLVIKQEFFDNVGRLQARFELDQIDRAQAIAYPSEGKVSIFVGGGPELVIGEEWKMAVQQILFRPATQPTNLDVDIPEGTYLVDRIADLAYHKGTTGNLIDFEQRIRSIGTMDTPHSEERKR